MNSNKPRNSYQIINARTKFLVSRKVGFFEVVTPLAGARVFICLSESCFGSHAFVSRSIWSNQSFTDSQNYALFRSLPGFCRKVRASGGCHAQIRRRATKGG
eukprot:sb/3478331/